MTPRAVVAVLAAGSVVFAIAQTMMIPLVEPIAEDTRASSVQIAWALTAPFVIAAALSPFWDVLPIRWGSERRC